MTDKVIELVRQHPVQFDQHCQDYRDTADAANIWKSTAKAVEEDVSGIHLRNIKQNVQSSFTIIMFYFPLHVCQDFVHKHFGNYSICFIGVY